jgi:hypothetical protein
VHLSGEGQGAVSVDVVNSDLVPDDHLFKVAFATLAPDSIRATTYALIDSTTGETLFETGRDLDGEGIGPVGAGLLPIVSTQETVAIDSTRTGFTGSSDTNIMVETSYQPVLSINRRRPGYPEDITIEFTDVVVDTGLAVFPAQPRPAKFTVTAHGPAGDRRLDFVFRDFDLDGTLSQHDERIDVVTSIDEYPGVAQITWRARLDTLGQAARGPIEPPNAGDVFEIGVTLPYGAEDAFLFRADGAFVDAVAARQQFESEPYVVPNPYVGSASFEPERFAISGRGERRIEFRGLPSRCTIRIYTVRGELVQTLHHDGSSQGIVPWNLRTKDNLDLAPGLYVFHVDGGELGSHIGKFAVIK